MSTDQIARDVLKRLEDAWNAADGEAFAAPYAQDGSFVNIRGELIHGPEIASGHAQIFRTIYAGSSNHMELVEAHRVSDDVIVATSRNVLDAPAGPLAGVHAAMSTSVLVRIDAEWRIAATQNTLVGAR